MLAVVRQGSRCWAGPAGFYHRGHVTLAPETIPMTITALPSLAQVQVHLPFADAVTPCSSRGRFGWRITFPKSASQVPNEVLLLPEAQDLYVEKISMSPTKGGRGTVVLNRICDLAQAMGYTSITCTPVMPGGEKLAQKFQFLPLPGSPMCRLALPQAFRPPEKQVTW